MAADVFVKMDIVERVAQGDCPNTKDTKEHLKVENSSRNKAVICDIHSSFLRVLSRMHLVRHSYILIQMVYIASRGT